jgi:hypothetical protein
VGVTLIACQRPGVGEAAGFGGTGRAETPFTSARPGVEVSLAVSLEAGTAELTIVDPTGAVRFDKRIDPGSPLNVTLPLAGGPGKWVAVLSYIDARGSRSVEWHEG